MGAAQIAPGPTPKSQPPPPPQPPVALGGTPGGVSGALKRAATKAHLDKVVPNKQVRSERFLGLNGARLLASIHIVIGHADQLPYFYSSPYFYSWGFTWVPWFFMLSGFVLCHARLHKKGNPHKKEEVLPTLRKRLAFIYPLYACGLVLDLLMLYWRDIRLPEWWAVLSQAFLCQSFVPWLPEAGVQAQCWFLSAMVPYWLSFDFVFRRLIIEVTRLRTCCVLLLLLSLPPWLYYAIAAQTNPTWYTAHEWEQVDTPTDIGVILLKFNPICYFHVFLFGMVLARLRFLVSDALSRAAAHVKVAAPPTPAELSFARSVERLLRFGVSLAYLGLLLVFNVPAIQPISWKLSARLSVLMLLQGLLIAGLAPVRREYVRVSGRAVDRLYDPVAELLSFSPPAWGHLSYAQYVLHMILMTALWPADMLSENWELFLFFVLLLAWSYLAANLVTVPAARWWNRRSPVQLFCVACTVAAVVCGMTAIDKSNRDNAAAVASGCEEYDGSYVPLLPEAYVQIDEGALDLRLNWTSSAALGERALINPSLLWATDPATNKTALMRAARAHAIGCTAEYVDYTDEETGIRWSEVVEVNVTWHADLALDDGVADAQDATALAAAWDGWDPAAWGLDGAADLQPLAIHKGDAGSWLPLCQSAVSWDNGTEIRRTTVLGAEDPKLTAFPEAFGAGAASVTFTSLPPDNWADPSCGYYKQLSDEDGVVFIEVLGDNKTSDAVKQGYQTVGALAAGADGAYTAEVAHIGCGELQSDEKNWIAFTDGDNLHYVYSVYPHSIYTVAADGSCRPQQYLTSNDAWGGSAAAYERLAALAEGGDLEFHGSGAAVPWDDGYMALFHTKYVEGNRSGAYVSFMYTFSGSPPFPITNVSRPLPLSAGNASFASSLSIAPGGSKLVVGYGAADAEARAFVMSTDYLRALFDWGVACTQPPPPPPPPLAPFPAEEWEYPLFKNESACLWPRLNNCSRQDRSVVAGYVAFLVVLSLCACLLRANCVVLRAVLCPPGKVEYDEDDGLYDDLNPTLQPIREDGPIEPAPAPDQQPPPPSSSPLGGRPLDVDDRNTSVSIAITPRSAVDTPRSAIAPEDIPFEDFSYDEDRRASHDLDPVPESPKSPDSGLAVIAQLPEMSTVGAAIAPEASTVGALEASTVGALPARNFYQRRASSQSTSELGSDAGTPRTTPRPKTLSSYSEDGAAAGGMPHHHHHRRRSSSGVGLHRTPSSLSRTASSLSHAAHGVADKVAHSQLGRRASFVGAQVSHSQLGRTASFATRASLEWASSHNFFQHAAPEEDDGMDESGLVCSSAPVTARGHRLQPLPITPATAPQSSPELMASADNYHCGATGTLTCSGKPKECHSAPPAMKNNEGAAEQPEEKPRKNSNARLRQYLRRSWMNTEKYKAPPKAMPPASFPPSPAEAAAPGPSESPPAEPRNLASDLKTPPTGEDQAKGHALKANQC